MNKQEYLNQNGVSESDWGNTPSSFKKLFDTLLKRMKKLGFQLSAKQKKLEWFRERLNQEMIRKRLNQEMKGVSDVISAPKFEVDIEVEFIGGIGKIRDQHYESGNWIYHVEMAMGEEPDFGRIGYETVIMLPEPEVKQFESI